LRKKERGREGERKREREEERKTEIERERESRYSTDAKCYRRQFFAVASIFSFL
jgi:hypothetical protein